jgi:hypothetical protein
MSGAALFGAGLGAVGAIASAFGQNSAAQEEANAIQQAAAQQAQTLNNLAGPWMSGVSNDLTAYKNLVFGQYGSQVGQNDPFLTAARNESLSTIAQNKQAGIAAAKYGSGANVSRTRGGILAADQNATAQTNQVNMAYGQGQRAYRNQTADRFSGGLSNLLGYGQYGTGIAANAANVQANGAMTAAGIIGGARSSFFGDLGQLSGLPIGNYLNQVSAKAWNH